MRAILFAMVILVSLTEAQTLSKKEKEIIAEFPVSAKGSVDAYTGLGDNSLTSRYEDFNLLEWDYLFFDHINSQLRTPNQLTVLTQKLLNVSNPYGLGGASERIVQTLKTVDLRDVILKKFHDFIVAC